jgi:hypothetical protein
MDGNIMFFIFAGAICLFFYFVPSIVANSRNHPNVLGIFLLNLLLGWSLIGWVIALVWAVSDPGGDSGGTRVDPVDVALHGERVSTAEPTKRCPACAEEILAAARKCKHCGEQLSVFPR